MASSTTRFTLLHREASADEIVDLSAATIHDLAELAKALLFVHTKMIHWRESTIADVLAQLSANRLALIYIVISFSSGRPDISDELRAKLVKAKPIAYKLMNISYKAAIRKATKNEVATSNVERIVRQIYETVIIHTRTGTLRKELKKKVEDKKNFSAESAVALLKRKVQPCALLFSMYFVKLLWLREEDEVVRSNCGKLVKKIWHLLPQEYVDAHEAAVLRSSTARKERRNTRGAELQRAAMEQTKPRQKPRRKSPLTVLTDSAAMRAATEGRKRKSAFTPVAGMPLSNLPPKKRVARSRGI